MPTEDAGPLALDVAREQTANGRRPLAVMVQGGVQNVQTAARIIGAGKADFVGLARPLLADPHLVAKALEGRGSEVMPCVGAVECFWRSLGGLPTVCLHNPVTGREGRWGLDNRAPAGAARRVAIVGAGPAGLEAAATAAQRGHVTVFERADQVGGHLRLEAALPHRGRWQATIDAFAERARAAGATLLTRHEVTSSSGELADFDTVLVATGARWDDALFQPSLPLIKHLPRDAGARVIGLDEAIEQASEDPTALGASVVIVDLSGDYLSLGLADLVSEAGAKVRVVSANDAVSLLVETVVNERMRDRDVELIPQVVVTGFHDGAVTLRHGWSGRETQFVGVDTVVAGTIRAAATTLFDAIASTHPDVRLIGDAVNPQRRPEAGGRTRRGVLAVTMLLGTLEANA